MTIVVQNLTSKTLYLVCKGADTILATLANSGLACTEFYQNCGDEFATQSLRTLLLGKKTISQT